MAVKKIGTIVKNGLINFKKAHLKYEYGKEYNNGFIPVKFDYSDTFQVKFLSRVYELMNNNGFNKKETNHIICENITKNRVPSVIDSAFRGYRSMELWEYDIIRRFFKLDNNLESTLEGEQRYDYSIENNKLILESKWMPKFYMVFNLEDYTDFEVDFSQDKIFRSVADLPKSDNLKIKRAFIECKRIMDWYFLKKTSRKTYPFAYNVIEMLFKKKWYNNDIRIRRENSSYLS